MGQDLKISIERPVSTLRGQVQDGIRALILDGQLSPGQRLSERNLIEATGVSRPVLREALAHLEARGLVTHVPNVGRVVAQPTKEEAVAIYEVRAVLEAMAAACFADRASNDAHDRLGTACDTVERAFAGGALAEIREATTHYYDVLLTECGNSEIGTALEPLLDRIAFLRSHSMSLPERHSSSQREMREMTDAILRRDAAAARKASEQHVQDAMTAALQRL